MRLFTGIFLCSLSAISYEIALIRILSISLSYHFAFMVVSISMLGIGLSGTVLSLTPKLKNDSMFGIYALLLSLSIPLSYIISNLMAFDPMEFSWNWHGILYIPAYYMALSIPFFFFGLIVSTAFALRSSKAGLIYGFDMLGAGIGALVIMLIMSQVSPGMSVFFISIISLAGAFIMGRQKTALAFAIVNLIIILINPDFTHIRISPYKPLSVSLKYPDARHIKTFPSSFSQIDVFQSPMVRFAPGLSLKYLGELPEQIGLSIDGADLNAITREDKKTLGFLGFLPSALPYELRKNKDVLLIEPKAGLHVLLARHYGSSTIHKVDSNPLIIDILRNEYRDFSGGIYDDNTHKGLARGYTSWDNPKIVGVRNPEIAGVRNPFDIVDISLMSIMPSGAYGIAEDYRFTVEAFKEYLSYLGEDGILSISLFIIPPPKTELRLLNTAIKAMEDTGITHVEKHITAIRSWGSICMLMSRKPFSLDEINTIKEFARKRNFDFIYYPEVKEDETNIHVKMPSNDYHQAFKKLIFKQTRDSFKRDYVFDINEVYDDSPFFHYHLRLKNLTSIYKVMGRKWQYFIIEEGYLLPVIFMQVLLISLILILLPFIRTYLSAGQGAATVAKKDITFSIALFSLLGIGYMFIEVPIIQKMILPLEQPVYAVSIVLSSVLISSGMGGMLSERYRQIKTPYTAGILAVIIVIYSFFLPYAIGLISAYSLPLKVFLSFALIMPLGLLMGIPFPLSMKIIGERCQPLIPWAWAVNGCFSVLAPILSIMLAMTVGFKSVMLIAGLAYALVFVLLIRLTRN